MKKLFRWSVIAAAGLALLLDGLALADYLLHPLAGDYNFGSPIYRAVFALVLLPLTLVTAFLIIKRVPGNLVGPLLIVWSGSLAYNSLRGELAPHLFAVYSLYDMLFGWQGFFMLFLHYPDGRIFHPVVARWVYYSPPVLISFISLGFLGSRSLPVPSAIPNPYFIPAVESIAQFVTTASILLYVPVLLAVPFSAAQRYRHGTLLERQQIKWLALFGSLVVLYSIIYLIGIPMLTGAEPMNPGSDFSAVIFFTLSGLFPPVSIGVAVFRYRLWDIDRIIRRTLIYTILTVVLTLIFFGSVVVLQTILAFLFNITSSTLAIVLSTLGIYALFTPLRSRIQRVIDRRFFRRKYDPERVLARFSTAARGELPLDALLTSLAENVDDAMQPERLSMWVKGK